MYFPEDFKERLKVVLSEKWHSYIETGDLSVVGGQLGKEEVFSLSAAEDIIQAFKEGREKEDVLGAAKKVLEKENLRLELRRLWNEQFPEMEKHRGK